MIGAIFSTTVPATIIRSDCRGVPRKTSAPKRARSCRASITAIISIAQQASPNCIGQIEERRAQLMTESTVVVRTLSSKRLSTMPMLPVRPSLCPVERFALPDVEIPDHEDHEEYEHLHEAEEPEPVEQHGPREEEDRLDVEHDEEDGNQEVPDGKAGVERQAGRGDPGFVGLELRRVRASRLDRLGDENRRQRQSCREQTQDENRKVIGHLGGHSIGAKTGINPDRTIRSPPTAP